MDNSTIPHDMQWCQHTIFCLFYAKIAVSNFQIVDDVPVITSPPWRYGMWFVLIYLFALWSKHQQVHEHTIGLARLAQHLGLFFPLPSWAKYSFALVYLHMNDLVWSMFHCEGQGWCLSYIHALNKARVQQFANIQTIWLLVLDLIYALKGFN